MVEAASSTPTPQQVLLPVGDGHEVAQAAGSVLRRQNEMGDWACTFRAYASVVSTRMVVLMEYTQSATDLLDLPTAPSDNLVIAQPYYVLAMFVKETEPWRLDAAVKPGGCCAENTNHVNDDDSKHCRVRF